MLLKMTLLSQEQRVWCDMNSAESLGSFGILDTRLSSFGNTSCGVCDPLCYCIPVCIAVFSIFCHQSKKGKFSGTLHVTYCHVKEHPQISAFYWSPKKQWPFLWNVLLSRINVFVLVYVNSFEIMLNFFFREVPINFCIKVQECERLNSL